MPLEVGLNLLHLAGAELAHLLDGAVPLIQLFLKRAVRTHDKKENFSSVMVVFVKVARALDIARQIAHQLQLGLDGVQIAILNHSLKIQ